MRGSLTAAIAAICAAGIIPAHAGLTECILSQVGGLRDHPRACGAHFPSPHGKASVSGSSPRMRGSLLTFVLIRTDAGIIPAHAGLTTHRTYPAASSGDHPRACGAHIDNRVKLILLKGSSPRMRGSHGRWNSSSSRPGIIPAHAGLTNRWREELLRAGDHPRACGAHIVLPYFHRETRGSP